MSTLNPAGTPMGPSAQLAWPGIRQAIETFDQARSIGQILAQEREIQAYLGPNLLKTPYATVHFPRFRYSTYGYVHYFMAYALYPEIMEKDFALQADLATLHNQTFVQASAQGHLPPLIRLDYDMAYSQGTFVDVHSLDRLWFPHFTRCIAPVRHAGIRLLWHCDGNLMQMVPRLLEAGLHGIQGFQYEDGMDYPQRKRSRSFCTTNACQGTTRTYTGDSFVATHQIEPNPNTVHGAFSRELAPVLTIDPGDTVRFRTLDAEWNLAPRRSTRHDEPPPQFTPRPEGHEDGHPLCGPVAIRGAEPGMTLGVRIDSIRPGTWGYTAVGGWPHPVNRRLGVAEDGTYLLWTLDATKRIGQNQYGQSVTLQPFMGIMGMPPDAPGLHSTVPPRVTGGNLDCKELVENSTLYLPIAVPGGLFSVGDGHARQGDGESCVTAIECPMACVELTFHLLPDLQLNTPRARTPAGWITFGLHQDLDEAALIALESMVDFVIQSYGLDRHHALGLVSVVVDLRITQMVNRIRGVHALLPHSAISELGLTDVNTFSY